jgi:WD40 repeat protein/serine/threonine protein kinase
MNEEEIFHQALARSLPEERAAYLEQACAGNPALRASIEALLRANVGAGGFMDHAAPGLLATVDETPATECPGTAIGPYKLLEQIGEGGFGIVFMALQQRPVRRKVALKILKPGMDTRQVVARFEAERQALALMDHPNIAHVFDGGETASGRPYFVMELVRGIPITEFCDQTQLPIRERLELYVTVCQAVQHAHQKGIIHRDLKPSNVLVTLHDDKPVVKVIDFGIAKATGQQLTEKTLFTNFAQLIGTPLYMSPEQAQLSGLDIDTRSDIYSLGVLLYELLTGTTPFDKERLRTAAYDEILRIIREEEPAKPSTRISRLGQAATAVSAKRQSDPRQLARLCRRELDWIVMKALEKDWNRRYESASAFAVDVERYLHDEPVHACPPSAGYRFRKFARRNRRTLAVSALLGIMLLAAVAAVVASALWAAAQAEAGARVEADARNMAERTLYFHSIALAHRELTANFANPAHAEQLLDLCPPERRGWEWYYLKRLWRTEPVILQERGSKEVNSVAFSPDGEQLAAACGDNAVRIWHLKTGRLVTLRGHEKYVYSVAFCPTDGRRLASTSADGTVRVWDLTTRQEVFRREGRETVAIGMGQSVTFSPDGRWLAAASIGGTVRVWDAATGQLRHTLPEHVLRASVAFSPDGRLLATGNGFGILQIWDMSTGECLQRHAGHIHSAGALAFSPDGRLLAAGNFDRLIDIWDTKTGEHLHTLTRHTGIVLGLAFSHDGRRLASASEDRTVRLWELSTGQELVQLHGHTNICQGLAFSPDGRLLASADRDGIIRFWDATPLAENEGEEVLTFREHTHEVWSVAISPDGKQIASAGLDPIIRVWDATTGQVAQNLSEIAGNVFSVAFSPDGRRLAAAGVQTGGVNPFALKVWEVPMDQDGRAFPVTRETFAVGFSPDGHGWPRATAMEP